MRNCIKRNSDRLFFAALVWLFLFPTVLHADVSDGFVVEYAQLNPGETEYLLDADIQYRFSQEAMKALEHGVALQIDIEIRAKQDRKWIWDKTIREVALSKKLEHHPLSNQYLVTNLNTGIKHQFQSLSHALDFLGTVKEYPFFALTALEQGKAYTVQVRARLNTESLPAPLRLSAYIASDWQLSSPWFKWSIEQ